MNAFTYYNGKDHLCLYICSERSGSIQQRGRTAWLKTLGIEVESRPDIASKRAATDAILNTINDSKKKKKTDAIPPAKTSSTLPTFLLEWNAANLIQRGFRDYQRRQAKKRAQAATRIQACTRRFLRRKAEQRAKAITVIQTAFRNYQQRKAEKRARAATVIQRAYRRHQWKKAVQKAHIVVRRACMRYRRDKGYFRSPEGTAVAKIQAVFQTKRKAKPKLTRKEYLKLLVIMLTIGVPLCIEIESLYSKYTAMMALKNPRSDVKRLSARIVNTRAVLFQASPSFTALDLPEERLRRRISEGMDLVREAKKLLKDIEDANKKDKSLTSSVVGSQVGGNKAGSNQSGGSKAGDSKAGSNQSGGGKAGDNKAGSNQSGGSKAGGNKTGGNKKGGKKQKTYGKGNKRK